MAIGRLGMSLDDLRRLTIEEFEAVVDEWNKSREQEHHDRWECMRMLATISIAPHTRQHVSPRELLQFPWENPDRNGETPAMSKDAQRQRLADLLKSRKG